MRLFEKHIGRDLDPAKETIVILVYENTKYDYIFGFIQIIIEELAKKYNLIFIGKDEISDYHKYGIFYKFVLKKLLNMKENDFIRVADLKDKESAEANYITNKRLLKEEIARCVGEDIAGVKKIIFGSDYPMILPLTSYVSKREGGDFYAKHNEFFDYVGEDKETIDKIDEHNEKVVNDYDKRVSVLAFSTHFKSIFSAVIEMIVEKNPDFNHAYGFVIDPAFYTPYFKHKNIPFTPYYFANDNRGTRSFKRFPIGELQHIVYDERKASQAKKGDLLASFSQKKEVGKDRDFFFAGTILQEKGDRVQNWHDFLENLNIENSKIYAPLRANGVVFKKDPGKKVENVAVEKFPQLYEDLKNHPMYAGHLIPAEYNDEIKRYKYGLILRCVSHEDSLNFRPILYAKYNILPFLDYEYDPACLQIPAEIQMHLTVRDSEDIEERVAHFNKYPEQRDKLLKELRDHFRIETFKKEELISYFE